jgi:hypothetical protein
MAEVEQHAVTLRDPTVIEGFRLDFGEQGICESPCPMELKRSINGCEHLGAFLFSGKPGAIRSKIGAK